MIAPKVSFFAATFSLALTAAAQSSIGLSISGEFANRTIRSSLEEPDPREERLSDGSSFAWRPGIAITAERQLTRLIAVDLQLRYQTAGYEFAAGTPPVDPQTGAPTLSPVETVRLRYDFIGLAVGASEGWGSGAWSYYVEEYLVPMLYVGTTTKTFAPGGVESTSREQLDRVNDFQLSVRAGVGLERMVAEVLRLRVGVVGHYHFTLTNDDAELREHLYGFGPQVTLARVFGQPITPRGKADEIYY